MRLPGRVETLRAADAAKRHTSIVFPYLTAPAPIMLMTFMVGFFYSLDALYGERRDRSILFWKSVPVSDRTTVLSKASIPLVVLPLIALVLSLAVQLNLLVMSTLALMVKGVSPGFLWGEFQFVQTPLVMVYGLAVHTLWFAPIHGWLLLVSGWARRTPILWTVLPLFAISLVEWLTFRTTRFPTMIRYRIAGAMQEAFAIDIGQPVRAPLDSLSQLSLGRFLSAPGLWAGLAFFAICVVAAIRLRRNREPI
jgi:ABC-2 type transport system permease protein